MEVKMKMKNNSSLFLSEYYDEFDNFTEVVLKFNESDGFDVEHIRVNKKDLHRLIGVLLHLQSKIK